MGSLANNSSEFWGKCSDNSFLSFDPQCDSKDSIRNTVWEFMEKNELTIYPESAHGRIPNFKGVSLAAEALVNLPEFTDAKIVKVNLDKSLEEIRFVSLVNKKELFVTSPKLQKGLFNRILFDAENSQKNKKLITTYGIDHYSKIVPIASRIKVNVLIIGSVALDISGQRIGTGRGFEDLEFAIGASYHSLGPETIVISVVHDIQVFENSFPSQWFSTHDLGVDIIVTPTRVLRMSQKLRKPSEIFWSLLSRKSFESFTILNELRCKDKRAGRSIRLLDDVQMKNFSITVSSSVKRRQVVPITDEVVEIPRGNLKSLNKSLKSNNQSVIFIGKLPRYVDLSKLRTAIQQRISYKYYFAQRKYNNYGFLYFDSSSGSKEDIAEKLMNLKLDGRILHVEPYNNGVRNKEKKSFQTENHNHNDNDNDVELKDKIILENEGSLGNEEEYKEEPSSSSDKNTKVESTNESVKEGGKGNNGSKNLKNGRKSFKNNDKTNKKNEHSIKSEEYNALESKKEKDEISKKDEKRNSKRIPSHEIREERNEKEINSPKTTNTTKEKSTHDNKSKSKELSKIQVSSDSGKDYEENREPKTKNGVEESKEGSLKDETLVRDSQLPSLESINSTQV